MNFNYMDTFVSESDNHDFEESRSRVSGLGAYKSNGYTAKKDTMCKTEDAELRKVEDSKGTRYEVLLDDEVYQRFPSLKNAIVYFCDFSGMTKKAVEKLPKVKEEMEKKVA